MKQDSVLQHVSPKRKRDQNDNPTTTLPTLQTSALPINRYLRRTSDSEPNDGDMSPRSAMSGRFRKMHLHGSPTKVRRLSTQSDSMMLGEEPSGPEITRTPSPTAQVAQTRPSNAAFTFRAGDERQMHPLHEANTVKQSISDPTPLAHDQSLSGNTPIRDTPHASVRSPRTPKRRARKSPPPPSFAANVATAAEEGQDPSCAEVDELSRYWWQPDEISGFTPADPDEDAYGVNGVGYQKTRAEQWKIDQRKKQQIAEWRSREAREARAARAGGRRALRRSDASGGRSRSGSPAASLLPPKPESPAKQDATSESVLMTGSPPPARTVHFAVD